MTSMYCKQCETNMKGACHQMVVTTSDCIKCYKPMTFGTSSINKLCTSCAKKQNCCKKCGKQLPAKILTFKPKE